MNNSQETSIKAHLRNIERATKVNFNVLLESLFLERFLVRVATSVHRDKLIFKGGLCLDQYLELGRETRDIDFLLHETEGGSSDVRELMDEIAADRREDGFQFSNVQVETHAIGRKSNPGCRLTLAGKLGNIKQKTIVDVGVGDVVRPRLLHIELMADKKPLFEDAIDIQAYPPEFIFAEKLEAIICLGGVNSRMKDYHDCALLVRNEGIAKDEFWQAIQETFANRGTKLTYIPDHSEKLQKLWKAFQSRNRLPPISIASAIEEINSFLKRIDLP